MRMLTCFDAQLNSEYTYVSDIIKMKNANKTKFKGKSKLIFKIRNILCLLYLYSMVRFIPLPNACERHFC